MRNAGEARGTAAPLTAHTITDDQIRALAREALTASQHMDCTTALRARREMLTDIPSRMAWSYPTTEERTAARARCAEILNTRSVRSAQNTKPAGERGAQ